MINLTWGWYSKHVSKGAVVLSAEEYDEIRCDLLDIQEKLDSASMNIDILTDHRKIDDSNPWKDVGVQNDIDIIKDQIARAKRYAEKASAILE